MSVQNRSVAQALAYVDECLTPVERRHFEQHMAGDLELRARVEQWRRQNEAIRRVYGEKWVHQAARNAANMEARLRGQAVSAPSPKPIVKRQPDPRQGDASPGVAAPRSEAAKKAPVEAPRRRLVWRSLCLLLVSLAAWTLSVAPAPVDRSTPLTASAFSAYRTFSDGRMMDFVGGEPAALEAWLRVHLGASGRVPNFAPAGFVLTGARVVPGAQGPAAFALYQNSGGQRVGLAIERGESTPTSQPFIKTSGDLTAIVLSGPHAVDATLVGKTGQTDLRRLAGLAATEP
jgi:anti-sigma factor RsiW